MTSGITDKAAIVGIGATEFSKDSGRSEVQLAVEAIQAALRDAGLESRDIDGMATYSMENNPENELFRLLGGRELKFLYRTHSGGGAACAPFLHAALAIVGGICEVVVIYRAMNERSGFRFGSGALIDPDNPNFEGANFGWYMPAGLFTPASWVAVNARRYMHEYGATSEDFGRISVACRDFAASNPAAWFHRRPISLEDHQNSRWIAEPLRLLDCCQESDGAVAVVVTSRAKARELQQPPVLIRGAAQGADNGSQMITAYYRQQISGLPEIGLVARQLFEQSGLCAQDMDGAILYDHFTPFVLMQLEEFGFCPRGQASRFVRDGHIGRGGKLPLNPHGGQLGEAYIHGLNGVSEAVRQLRGNAVNQIAGATHLAVTAGTGVPTSGLILGRES